MRRISLAPPSCNLKEKVLNVVLSKGHEAERVAAGMDRRAFLGALAGALGALETIPLLIFAQVTGDAVPESGDLAWILVGTQKAYVAEVYPVVGDGAAAFVPIPGVVQEGAIMRVVDAVVIVYRTQVHRSLVAMTTKDWGQSTEQLGYDPRAWWAWYNEEYVPFCNERARVKALAEQGDDTRTPPTPPRP